MMSFTKDTILFHKMQRGHSEKVKTHTHVRVRARLNPSEHPQHIETFNIFKVFVTVTSQLQLHTMKTLLNRTIP